MKFRRNVDAIPEVPDDAEVRKRALDESMTRMREAARKQKIVDRQAKRFTRTLDENHFIQRLSAAYGTTNDQ